MSGTCCWKTRLHREPLARGALRQGWDTRLSNLILAHGECPGAPRDRALVDDCTLASVRLLRQLDLRHDDRIVCALARELNALTQEFL